MREAHALDSAMPMDFGLVEDPTTDAEREHLAGNCVEDLDLRMPALIDGVDDKVGRAYAGWPDRLFLVGRDGKIAYAGGPGPRGLDPEAWQQAIGAELQRIGADKTPPAKPPTDKGGDK